MCSTVSEIFSNSPLTINLCLFSSWQMRRVVWTKDFLVCSNPGQDVLIDAIPLYEVTSVQSVHDHDDVANQAGEHAEKREGVTTMLKRTLMNTRRESREVDRTGEIEGNRINFS